MSEVGALVGTSSQDIRAEGPFEMTGAVRELAGAELAPTAATRSRFQARR